MKAGISFTAISYNAVRSDGKQIEVRDNATLRSYKIVVNQDSIKISDKSRSNGSDSYDKTETFKSIEINSFKDASLVLTSDTKSDKPPLIIKSVDSGGNIELQENAKAQITCFKEGATLKLEGNSQAKIDTAKKGSKIIQSENSNTEIKNLYGELNLEGDSSSSMTKSQEGSFIKLINKSKIKINSMDGAIALYDDSSAKIEKSSPEKSKINLFNQAKLQITELGHLLELSYKSFAEIGTAVYSSCITQLGSHTKISNLEGTLDIEDGISEIESLGKNGTVNIYTRADVKIKNPYEKSMVNTINANL